MKTCKTKTTLKQELVREHKVIDQYNNILNFNKFMIVRNSITKEYSDKYKIAGSPIYVDDVNRRKAVFNDEYLSKIDVIRGIEYGKKEYVPYQETFIGSTLTTFDTKDLSKHPLMRGDIISHKNDVFVFLGYSEKGLRVYSPKPLDGNKIQYVNADEIQAFRESAEFVTYNKQPYLVFPNNTVMDNKENFHDSDMTKAKVLEMRTYLRNLDIGMEDVVIQLYENSNKTMSYQEFFEKIANDLKSMKLNYSLREIKDAIKCY